MVTIVDPHIKRDSGYKIHTEATSLSIYIKNKHNSDYEVCITNIKLFF